MNTVIFCGDEKDGAVANTLFAFLRAVGAGSLHLTARSLSFTPGCGSSADYFVVETGAISEYRLPSGILVFRPDMTGMADDMRFPPHFVAVVEPRNTAAIEMLKAQNIRTITCGLSPKDTVTFSSLMESSAVISLQRGIESTDGEEILPKEIPVTFTCPKPDYAVLACAAVLLLSGRELPDVGIPI